MLEEALGNLFLRVLTPILAAVRSSDGMAQGYYQRGSGDSTYLPKKPSDQWRRVTCQFFTNCCQVSIEGLGGRISMLRGSMSSVTLKAAARRKLTNGNTR